MALDPYAPCPGGTGKKLKFCCADLAGELQKIDRMIEGQQFVAAVEYIERLEPQYPQRACLLSMKTELQLSLSQFEQAAATIGQFIQSHPDNPVALASYATILTRTGDAEKAVGHLQTALEQSKDISAQVYQAIGEVGHALLVKGKLCGARAHLLLQAGLGMEHDRQALGVLMRINGSDAFPLLFKEDRQLLEAPENCPAKAKFDAAYSDGRAACWRRAESQFTALAKEHPNLAEAWHNAALLRSWLGDDDGAAEAWRTYAQQAIPPEEAIDAEATAQLLGADPIGDPIEIVAITFPITDYEKLEEHLSGERRANRMYVDLTELADEGVPPPRGAYHLLDRPLPRSSADMARTDIPLILGQFYLFGKETDREARLEFVTPRDGNYGQTLQALRAATGGRLGPAGAEEKRSQISASQHALSFNWRFPEDITPEQRSKFISEQQQEIVRNVWPKTPMRLFHGKTPLDVARDPGEKIKLLAAIFNLEVSANDPATASLYDGLREKLGLPRPEPVAVSPDSFQTESMNQIPLTRLHRVDPAQLSDEQLPRAFQRAMMYTVDFAIERFSREMVRRGSAIHPAARRDALLYLASHTSEAESRELLKQGRAQSLEAGFSCASFDLIELQMVIRQGSIADVGRLVQHIARDHRQEPSIAESLHRILYQAGIVDENGQLTMPLAPEPVAAAASNEIWTPGSSAPGGESKKLWIPE